MNTKHIVTVILLILMTPAVAVAQTQLDIRADYVQGIRDFSRGQYRPALEAFERAYDRTGDPTLLFNIATTLERLAEPSRAAQALQRFLVAVPDAPNHTEVEHHISTLLAADAAIHSSESPAPQPASAASVLPASTHALQPHHHPLPVLPIATLTGSGVVGVVGVIVALAGNYINEASHAPDELTRASDINSATSQYAAGWTTLGVGAVGVVASVAALVVSLRHTAQAPRISLDASQINGGAMIGVQGTW